MEELIGCAFMVVGFVLLAAVVVMYVGAVIVFGLGIVVLFFIACLLGGACYLLFWGYWKAEIRSQAMMSTWSAAQLHPADTLYAFGPGWRVCSYMMKNLREDISVGANYCFGRANELSTQAAKQEWYWGIAMNTITAGWFAAAFGLYLAFAIVTFILLSIQGALLALWSLYLLVVLAVFVVSSTLFSWIYGIFCICPNCHKPMSIGVYYCPVPGCNTLHNNLRPNFCGILYHRCKKCRGRLPALDLLGRWKLHRICANNECRRPLSVGVGAGTNIHIPVIGGPAVGKTNYLVMATREFMSVYEQQLNYKVAFIDADQRDVFRQNMQKMQVGREVDKTVDIVPPAYTMKIQAPHTLVAKLAYIYDAAGEAFKEGQNTRQLEYFQYVDGMIFLIDPCSMPLFYQEHQTFIEQRRFSLRPSDLRPLEAFERMMHMFEASVVMQKRRKYKQALAVVVTKVDVLGLEDEIGASAARRLMEQDASFHSEEQAIHHLVRNFLCKYESENFIRLMEAYFSNIRYFSCSSLGRSPVPGEQSPFIPVRVLNPLLWLLNKTGAIKKVQPQVYVSKPLPMPMPK